jgi:hypothetical protein
VQHSFLETPAVVECSMTLRCSKFTVRHDLVMPVELMLIVFVYWPLWHCPKELFTIADEQSNGIRCIEVFRYHKSVWTFSVRMLPWMQRGW